MKIIRPRDRPPNSRIGRPVSFEGWKTHYIMLECGHLTDWDTQLRYSVFRPVRGKFLCETCDRWFKPIKIVKPEKPNYQEPLF